MGSVPRPELTLILTATDSAPAVQRWLESVGTPFSTEIIVVGEPRLFPSKGEFSGIGWLPAPSGTTVPRLRRLGLDASSGAVIVFAEDSVEPMPGWLEAYRSLVRDPKRQAATGPVGYDAGGSAWDRAVYVFEYGVFGPNQAESHPSHRLAGNNFAVRADLLSSQEREIHEHEIPTDSAWFCADAEVIHTRRYQPSEALLDRFRFGVAYGRRRWRGKPLLLRFLVLLAIPAIALIQTVRMVRLLGKPHLSRFRSSLPVLLVLILSWSIGEGIGSFIAPASDRQSDKGGQLEVLTISQSREKEVDCILEPSDV